MTPVRVAAVIGAGAVLVWMLTELQRERQLA